MDPQTQFWKDLALWLTDCQAATAQGYLMRKSASKSETRRHVSICETTRRMIEAKSFDRRASMEDSVLKRLRDVETAGAAKQPQPVSGK